MSKETHRHAARGRLALTWLLWLSLTGLLVQGCAEEQGPVGEELGLTCTGACDGFGDKIRSLYDDASRLDLGDLLNVSAELATDQLNDALAFEGVALEVGAPRLYALPEQAEQDHTLDDIQELVTGLAARYGERELTTQVNELRLEHLRSSADEVYAEGSFRIEGGSPMRWQLPAAGLEGAIPQIGFDLQADLEARVIAPFRGELPATGQVMLRALREGTTRGFILPRDIDDLQQMAPGELIGLRGGGSLAINLGIGLPLLVAEPASSLTYSLVFSAALRAALSGQLDVQLVRLGGDEVVVDVGLSTAQVRSARVAIEDGWGVQGLIELEVELGNQTINLGQLAQSALESRLNRQLNLVSAHAERTSQQTRLSVARFRFSLADASAETEQALAQAIRGDVRLAQALANRGQGGVVAEFDLLRSGVSTVSHAGLDLFGMSFFTTTEEREGTAVVQTPGGATTLLFDSLREESGWFFSTHGYTRVGLAGLTFDPSAPGAPTGQANLQVQLVEGDDYMERDKLLDHLDALILAVGGEEALAAIEGPGNELQRYVETTCPDRGDPWDDCYVDVLSDPRVVSLRAEGEAALASAIERLPQAHQELLLAAGRARLTAQATKEPAAQLVGPPSSVLVDYRLDDDALTEILDRTRALELRRLLEVYVGAMEVERDEELAELDRQRSEAVSEASQTLEAMVGTFSRYATSYTSLVDADTLVIQGLGSIGASALELRFPVDAANRPLYTEATASSLAQRRRELATELFDELRDQARALRPHPEQVAGYLLLGMSSPRRMDLRFEVQLDTEDNWAQPFDHYREAGYAPLDEYARGDGVSLIGGGLFDVEALIDVER